MSEMMVGTVELGLKRSRHGYAVTETVPDSVAT